MYSPAEMRGATLYAKLLHALSSSEMSREELALFTGLAPQTIARYIKALRDFRLVQISAWGLDPQGRASIPSYTWGPGLPDAKKPPPLSSAEKQRRYRAGRNSIRSVWDLAPSRD